MQEKPIIIVVEDNRRWLNDICEILIERFKTDVEIERFISFNKAEKRILKQPIDFNLLITDIFPSKKSKETKGLKFANFVHEINSIPVIVVTGETVYVKPALKNENIADVFDKGTFDRIDFIDSVNKIISPLLFADRTIIQVGRKNATNRPDFF